MNVQQLQTLNITDKSIQSLPSVMNSFIRDGNMLLTQVAIKGILKKHQYYFIDPLPIVSARNFRELKVYQSKNGDYGLMISLDNGGASARSIATQKAIGKRLAFILDNKLLEAPSVNSQITGGTTALNGGNYLQSEIEYFKKIIESEK